MKIKTILLTALASMSLLIVGCSSTTESMTQRGVVMPQKDGSFLATVSNNSGSTAERIAQDSARQTCSGLGKKVKHIETTSRDVKGVISSENAVLVDVAAEVARNTGYNSPVTGADLTAKVIVQYRFSCIL